MLDSVQLLLEALPKDPGDDAAWLALADALEEKGDPRGESTRLSVWLRRRLDDPDRAVWEARLHELVESEIRVCLPRRSIRLTDEICLEMILIPPGSFLMGSPRREAKRCDDEQQHRVTLTKGYWLGMFEVSQAQWSAVMKDNPSEFRGPNRPVESVSWEAAQAFCGKLSERTGKLFRLPTEAQWEYACRAGTTTPYSFGSAIGPKKANYDTHFSYGGGGTGRYREETLPVGSFPANPWGFFEMHGNVAEWCQDYSLSYTRIAEVDPEGIEGSNRVIRGGSWYNIPEYCRSAFRFGDNPSTIDSRYGCRVLQCLD